MNEPQFRTATAVLALISRIMLHDLVNLNVFVFSYVFHTVVLDLVTRKINFLPHNCVSCVDGNLFLSSLCFSKYS
jgi:hypothetical protein